MGNCTGWGKAQQIDLPLKSDITNQYMIQLKFGNQWFRWYCEIIIYVTCISILFCVCSAIVNIVLILSIQFILGVFHSGYIKQIISHLGKDFPQKPLRHGSLQHHVEGLII